MNIHDVIGVVYLVVFFASVSVVSSKYSTYITLWLRLKLNTSKNLWVLFWYNNLDS